MKKFMKIASVLATVLALGMIVSCGSTKVTETTGSQINSNNENNVSVATDNVMVISDWTNRSLGIPAQPQWLINISAGNGELFKKTFGVDENRIVKVSMMRGKSEIQALNLAMGEFGWSLGFELGYKIIGKLAAGTGTYNQNQMNDLRNYAIRIKANVVGAREEARFWQRLKTIDNKTKKEEQYYQYNIVYSLDKNSWEAIVKHYMTELIGDLAEAGIDQSFLKEVGALYSEILNEEDKIDEQKAKRELAAAQAVQAKAESDAAIAQANLAAKKLDAEAQEKANSAAAARELMYQSFLK